LNVDIPLAAAAALDGAAVDAVSVVDVDAVVVVVAEVSVFAAVSALQPAMNTSSAQSSKAKA
jgi:hypothetical protein